MRILTALDVYNELITQGIKKSTGKILFSFINTEVTISAKSTYGYVFQDWLGKWLTDNDIFHEQPHNSQEFPDFYLLPDNKQKGLLEIKTFDHDASPNFDVANFESYISSLIVNPFRIDADYLIFSYSLKGDSFNIENMWLKKIWEICCPSDRFAVRCQVKRNMIYNIRPAIWYSTTSSNRTFKSKEDFIKALYKTLLKYHKTKGMAKNWYSHFSGKDEKIDTLM